MTSGGRTVKPAISAGSLDTCALLPDGTVRCWGYNAYGQLGNGTTTNSSTPVAVSDLTGVTAVSAGPDSTCALLADTTLRCWGGTPTGYSSTPVAVSGLSGVTAVSPGNLFICALLADTTVRCWGENGAGELGDGTTTESLTPVAVSGLTGVTAISAGPFHTCALLTDGTVRCWGFNPLGELGNGTTDNSSIPVAVSGLTGVTAISAGFNHTCALLTDGTVRCWGSDQNGQLGNGTTDPYYSSTPVAVSGLTRVTAISAGGPHSCALLSAGKLRVRCWGYNVNGELGNGTTYPYYSSTPVAVSGLPGVLAISAGYDHNCALLHAGTIRCWGDNDFGQLGNGTNTDSSTPVTVIGLPRSVTVSSRAAPTALAFQPCQHRCLDPFPKSTFRRWKPPAPQGLQ